MSHSKPILDELIELSEVVAQLPADAPYQIPPLYFENLEIELVNRIKALEPAKHFTLLSGVKYTTPYSLPEGYFDELPGLLLNNIKLLEAATQKEELAILSPLLLKLNKNLPFKLPEQYFEEFPSDIIAGVNAVDYVNQELEGHTPMLNDLKRINVFEVPDRYFDTISQTLLSNVKRQKRPAVVSIFNKKLVRYAAAALVGGIISFSAWMFFQQPKAGNDIADMKKISNDEIVNYLESVPVIPDDNGGIAYTLREDDVIDLLADISDDEIESYVEQHAVSKDLIIN